LQKNIIKIKNNNLILYGYNVIEPMKCRGFRKKMSQMVDNADQHFIVCCEVSRPSGGKEGREGGVGGTVCS
jgi:hypothetical protein